MTENSKKEGGEGRLVGTLRASSPGTHRWSAEQHPIAIDRLEGENAHPEKLPAEAELDTAVLKELAEREW